MSCSLDALALVHGTDKGPQAHNYLRHYERHLGKRREEPLTILEIGVQSGASLRVWRDYFPRARVVGVDLRPVEGLGERIEVAVGNQGDPEFLRGLAGNIGGLDVVIDDGSHRGEDQRVAFETLYPHLRPAGLYFVEDLHTAYWDWGPSFVEYLKDRLEEVVFPGRSALGDPRNHPAWKEIAANMNDFQRQMMCLHVYSNLAVFEKFPEGEAHA